LGSVTQHVAGVNSDMDSIHHRAGV